MEIQKYSEFINEARVKKDEIVEALTKLFKEKPTVEIGDNWPDEKGIYSMSGMKHYLKDKYTSLQASQAHHDILNDKKSGIKVITVRIEHWEKSMPYWYIGLTDQEAKKLKEEYEKKEKEAFEKEINKRKDRKEESKASSVAKIANKKEQAAKKTAERKAAAPKKATVKKSKASGEGVEKAPRRKKTK